MYAGSVLVDMWGESNRQAKFSVNLMSDILTFTDLLVQPGSYLPKARLARA